MLEDGTPEKINRIRLLLYGGVIGNGSSCGLMLPSVKERFIVAPDAKCRWHKRVKKDKLSGVNKVRKKSDSRRGKSETDDAARWVC